jgi:hypothetical protein
MICDRGDQRKPANNEMQGRNLLRRVAESP